MIEDEKNKNIQGFEHLKKIDNQISALLAKLEIEQYNIYSHE